MSGIKTVEELEKELHNAKASLSYHKNKHKNKAKRASRGEGESAQAKANRLAANVAWNDDKLAMAHVVAVLTANDEDYEEARDEAYVMPVEEVRELVKGHEADIEKQVKVLQERRRVKTETRAAKEARRKAKPKSPNRIFIQSAKPNCGSSTIQPERDYTTGGSSVEAIVHVKASTLRFAVAAVESNTGFDGLSKDQVVGHILSRYLQDNS